MNNTRSITILAVGLAAVMILAPAAWASTTNIWMTASSDDFTRGKLEHAAILSTGQLAPGMGTTRFPMDEISIWSTAFAPDGTAYIGTGNNGLVYHVKAKEMVKASIRLRPFVSISIFFLILRIAKNAKSLPISS